MRRCEFCDAENSDIAKHCVSCNQPMTAEAAKEDVKTTEAAHHKSFVRREILYGAIAVAVVVGLGFAYVRNQHRKEIREGVRHFYTEFLSVDESHVPQFWKCVTRSDKLPKDNLELDTALKLAIPKSGGKYGKYARGMCLPMLKNAAPQLQEIKPAAEVAADYPAYIEAVRTLQKDAEEFIASVEAVEKSLPADAALKKVAGTYHYAGAESAETYSYDKFLRCAVPGFAAMKEPQELLQYLGTVMPDPARETAKWRTSCYPLIEKTEGATADPDYKAKVAAFSSDDRDVQAFQDCLKAANDAQLKASSAPFEKAWYTSSQARDEFMKKVGEYLAD